MGVKIADRQIFHAGKHIVPQIPQSSLGYIDHDHTLGKHADDAGGIEARHPADSSQKRAEIVAVLFEHGHDIIVDQGLHEHGSLQVAQNGNDNADHHDHHLQPVTLADIFQNAHNRSHICFQV